MCLLSLQKLVKPLVFLKRNFTTAPQNIRELAYLELVCPQVEYAPSAWSPWLLHDITKLEKLQ